MFIYRFLDLNNDVIYIGKTIDLNNRILNQHFSSGHLPKECYRSVSKIEYTLCLNRDDMSIKERYLINQYSPKFNKQYNNKSIFDFEIKDFNWIEFNGWSFKEKKIDKNLKLETQLMSGSVHLKRSEHNIAVLIDNLQSPIFTINNEVYLLVELSYVPRILNTAGRDITPGYQNKAIQLQHAIKSTKQIKIPNYKIFFQANYANTKRFGIPKDSYLKLPGVATFLKLKEIEKVVKYYERKNQYKDTNEFLRKILKMYDDCCDGIKDEHINSSAG